MKLTEKRLLELLKTIGVGENVELVNDESDEDTSVDDLIGLIDTSRSSIFRPRLTEEIKTEYESGFKPRMLGTIKSALSRMGIKLTDEFETVDSMLKKAVESYDSKYSKDTESLRNQLQEAISNHETAVSELESKHENALREAEQKYIDRDIDEIILGYLNEIPRAGGDSLIQAKQAKQWLRENYHIHYNPNDKSLELRQKDKPEQNVYNENKTRFKEVKETVKEWAEKIGITVKDNRNQNPSDVMNRGNPIRNGAVNANSQRKGEEPMNVIDEQQSHLESLGLFEGGD